MVIVCCGVLMMTCVDLDDDEHMSRCDHLNRSWLWWCRLEAAWCDSEWHRQQLGVARRRQRRQGRWSLGTSEITQQNCLQQHCTFYASCVAVCCSKFRILWPWPFYDHVFKLLTFHSWSREWWHPRSSTYCLLLCCITCYAILNFTWYAFYELNCVNLTFFLISFEKRIQNAIQDDVCVTLNDLKCHIS